MSLANSLPRTARRSITWLPRVSPVLASPKLRVLHEQTRPKSTQPAYEGHIPLNTFEAGFLAVGSALMSLANPRRGDMVAALGDVTSGPVLPRLRDAMLESPEGRRILKERPRVNSATVDMNKLALLPEGSFGRAYVTWLERCGVTPDTREPVHYVDDPELAYVLLRYRECHDFYHCICNLPVNVESELALKFFEFANLGLPMAGFAAAFGHLRLTSAKRQRLFSEFVPWAVKCGGSAKSLISVYWEERWSQNVDEMKRELGIWDPPEARWSRPLSEAKAAAEKRGKAAEAQLTGQP
ncbi:ubiquinone biosynthesis protein COQ4 mitochondrial [Fomitopsis serialis]|uniref:ubiquinone biosynthesis protein COQ4 mitochondrial n=1 Tax=Fomitopsis serialis TaxID=139415 RepID=UPI0020082520|nr:ubiquinone biosynthesis protein COQ4 mitochondrial [Neoantrodia serialis]KAH9928345.1 ubiquinone biosynthesis protein COQ4 mitochondrial [Neoantrodia serialis]